jgi:hypothetical protein
MLAGIDDVATRNCFSRFVSVSLERSRLFAMVSFNSHSLLYSNLEDDACHRLWFVC